MLVRINIRIEVPRADYEKLSGDRLGETSESIRARVRAVRDIQNKRFAHGTSNDIVCNADMHVGEVQQFAVLGPRSELDALGNESTQFVSACLSSHPEIITDFTQSRAIMDIGSDDARECGL